jgi:hypothetical protein
MNERNVAQQLTKLAFGLLFGGVAFGKNALNGRTRNRIPLSIRMLSSALILLAALILTRQRSSIARLSAGGMAFGFLGDLVMAEVVPVPQHVIGGMLSFGVGHGLYLRALTLLGRRRGLISDRASLIGLGFGWGIALVGWWVLARSPARGVLINGAALAYALLLGSMAGLAGALAAQDRTLVPLATGGSLFLLSDLILAGAIFRETFFPYIGDVIWLTYLSGQALIINSLALPEC